MDNPFYIYKAKITKVYDGDTCTADIDLGFGVWLRGQKIRLYGIDTPEIRGEEREEGLLVKEYLSNLILDKEVILETEKDKTGKYGRWLGTIYLDGEDINEKLLREGMATEY